MVYPWQWPIGGAFHGIILAWLLLPVSLVPPSDHHPNANAVCKNAKIKNDIFKIIHWLSLGLHAAQSYERPLISFLTGWPGGNLAPHLHIN